MLMMNTKVKPSEFARFGDIVSSVIRTSYKTEFNSQIQDAIYNNSNDPIYNAGKTAYSFRNSDDTESLIVLHNGSSYRTDCEFEYVYVGDMDLNVFNEFYLSMIAAGFKGVEAPDESPAGPNDAKWQTCRAVLGTYNVHGRLQMRGVIVNPPYPVVANHFKSQSFRPRRKGLGSLLAALVAGAAVATVVSRLGRNH